MIFLTMPHKISKMMWPIMARPDHNGRIRCRAFLLAVPTMANPTATISIPQTSGLWWKASQMLPLSRAITIRCPPQSGQFSPVSRWNQQGFDNSSIPLQSYE